MPTPYDNLALSAVWNTPLPRVETCVEVCVFVSNIYVAVGLFVCITCVNSTQRTGCWVTLATGGNNANVVCFAAGQFRHATARWPGHACSQRPIWALHCCCVVFCTISCLPGYCSNVGYTVHKSSDGCGSAGLYKKTEWHNPSHTTNVTSLSQ